MSWKNAPWPGAGRTSEGPHMKPAEVERLRRSVPADTRSFSARLFGDPLPGRSALDKRRSIIPTNFLSYPRRPIADAATKVHLEDRYSNSEAVI